MAAMENLSVVEITDSSVARLAAHDLIDTYLEPVSHLIYDGRDYLARRGIEVVLGAYANEQLVGVSTAAFQNNRDNPFVKELLIKHVVVEPELEGCGIGSALVGRFEQFAGLTGTSAIRLAATRDVTGFYEKLGYTVEPDTGWYRKNITAN